MNQYLQKIEDYIANLDFKSKEPKELYQPIDYILNLKAKRFRPILAVLAFKALKNDYEKIIPLAVGLEMFHNFTLVHDDIMDNAPLRRGKASIHENWNENVAILSGDALLVAVYPHLIQNFPEKSIQIITYFTKTALEVCEGQSDDMLFADLEEVTIELYLEMIRKKTAVLLAEALRLAGLCADKSQEIQQLLYSYGENLGIAFQLQDDYLDVYAEQENFGKQVGGDILENKKTYLSLKAFSEADKAQKHRLQNLQRETDSNLKIKEALKLYEKLNIQKTTLSAIEKYYEKASKIAFKLTEIGNFDELFLLVDQYQNRIK